MIDPNEISKMPVVYAIPGMESVIVRKNLTYKIVNNVELKMDVYYPPNLTEAATCPAVIFVHGDGPAEMLSAAREMAVYTSYGRLVAALGLIAITFNHRSTERFTKFHEATDDIDDLVHYIREHAEELRVEKDRLCLWTFSAGVPMGLRTALRDRPAYIRALISYYGPLDIRPARAFLPENVISDSTLAEFSSICYLEQEPQNIAPMFIMKAGLDRADLNASIDEFVYKALSKNLAMSVASHPTGHHAFDILDNDERSREIIRQTLDFIKTRLG